jgi:hypothetical protein
LAVCHGRLKRRDPRSGRQKTETERGHLPRKP